MNSRNNSVLFCWVRLPDLHVLCAAGVYCSSKALQEHYLSCSTIGQKSWQLKLRISLVQINKNTKERSCGWSSAFLLFHYLHEIQFCPSTVFSRMINTIFFGVCSAFLFCPNKRKDLLHTLNNFQDGIPATSIQQCVCKTGSTYINSRKRLHFLPKTRMIFKFSFQRHVVNGRNKSADSESSTSEIFLHTFFFFAIN